jgi:hypothetical protein
MPNSSFNPIQVRCAGSDLNYLAPLKQGNVLMKSNFSNHRKWKTTRLMDCFPSCRQPTFDLVPFGHWTLRDEAAQRRSPQTTRASPKSATTLTVFRSSHFPAQVSYHGADR